MIRCALLFSLIFLVGLSCKNGGDTKVKDDKQTALQADSTEKEQPLSQSLEKMETHVQETLNLESHGELYNPYDFPLEVGAIKLLLGKEAEVKEQFVDDEFGSYTYTIIQYKDSELSFYDYEGSHSARITTQKLSVLGGIKIGMNKMDFINRLKIDSSNAATATTFNLTDDYGNLEFAFRADTLYLINGFYDEGE